MVKVKKPTINTDAFEKEMESLKVYVMKYPEDTKGIVKAINNTKYRLIEWIDERDAELFHIPEWLDGTATVRRSK